MIKNCKKVRLSQEDLTALVELFHKHFLKNDRLWIFGSRADLSKKGGDIDIYIETKIENLDHAINAKANFLWDLESKIGEQKVDVVLNVITLNNKLPVYSIAKKEGVKIL